MSRIFVSYRASDGKKDASRLATDLVRVFGEASVFFDKADLTGGTSWRQQVLAALGSKPVVVLLLTPDYFGAVKDGARRIDQDNDPVRLEILAAMEAGATVLPLLTEGVGMPAAAELPAALAGLREHHALKLRTDDWDTDFARLVKDLTRLGLTPLAPPPGPGPQPTAKPWRALLGVGLAAWLVLELAATFGTDMDSDSHIGAALLLGLPIALAWITWRWTRTDPARLPRYSALALLVASGWSLLAQLGQAGTKYNAEQAVAAAASAAAVAAVVPAQVPTQVPNPVPQPLAAPAAGPPAATRPVALPAPPPAPADPLTGTWVAQLANGQQLPFNLKLRGEQLTVQTQRIDIRNDASMQPLVLALAMQGVQLQDIRIRGEGSWDGDEAELAMALQSGDGQRELDQGHMQLLRAPDGRSLSGSLQFSSGAPVPVVLRRP